MVDPAFRSIATGWSTHLFTAAGDGGTHHQQVPERPLAHEAGPSGGTAWWASTIRARLDGQSPEHYATARGWTTRFCRTRRQRFLAVRSVPIRVTFGSVYTYRLTGYRDNAKAGSSPSHWRYCLPCHFRLYNKTALWLHTL